MFWRSAPIQCVLYFSAIGTRSFRGVRALYTPQVHLSWRGNRAMAGAGKTSEYVPVAELIPRRPTLVSLQKAAKGCRGCDLYLKATQTVFGEGPASARVMLVGEQPGDREDLAGKPFVGPAGRVLDDALQQAGIDR